MKDRNRRSKAALALSYWRARCASWGCSIILHLPILYWQGGSLPSSPDNFLKPLEVSLAAEGELQSSGASGSAAAHRDVTSDSWKSFKVSGPWSKLAKLPAMASDAANQLRDSLKGSSDSSNIPEPWQSKQAQAGSAQPASQGMKGLAYEASKSDMDESLSKSLAPTASPWASPGKSSKAMERPFAGSSGQEFSASAWHAHAPRDEAGGSGRNKRAKVGEGALYQIRGPLARRKVVYSMLPPYPEWALEQGLEASVTVYFVVLPDGRIQDPILIRKTSGDPRLDSLIVRSLKEWRFAALPIKSQEEQWGLFTFHFRLRG